MGTKSAPKRRRLWLNDGPCIRLRVERRNHVWSCDCVSDQTRDGRKRRMLDIVDEYSRTALAMMVPRSFKSHDMIYVLADLMIKYGIPDYIRSDSGSEFVATSP
jgi:putative transposase